MKSHSYLANPKEEIVGAGKQTNKEREIADMKVRSGIEAHSIGIEPER